MGDSIVNRVNLKLFKGLQVSGPERDAAELICRAVDPHLNGGYPNLNKTAKYIVKLALDKGWPGDIANSPLTDLASLLPK